MNQRRIADFGQICGEILKNNLLIQFWVIDSFYLLDSRDLDCFGESTIRLAMTGIFAFDSQFLRLTMTDLAWLL